MTFTALCLIATCLWGTPDNDGPRVWAGAEVYNTNEVTDRLFGVEDNRLALLVLDRRDAYGLQGVAFPLRIGRGWFQLDGGVAVSTLPFPERGSWFNWVARAHVRAGPVSIAWFHQSISPRSQNPSLDSLLIGVKF